MASLPSLTDAKAAEGGASLFIPGLSVPMGGFLPPPGVYFDSTGFTYSGKLTGGRTISFGRNVVAGVKANIEAYFATGLWVTPYEILGGNLAFSVSMPFGQPDIRAGALISGPIIRRLLGRPLTLGVEDEQALFGDPVVAATIGWHSGNWHWKLSATASIPGGAYRPDALANLALNRPVGDFSAGITYLDPVLGLDISAVGGVALNGRNEDTDYTSGTEAHLDVSISQNLTKDLSVGVIGAHYQQLTRDTGPGATIGPFKGRVTAVGGTVGYTFELGTTPVSTRIRVLREVDVENRPQGTIGWLQVTLPLWSPPPTSREAAPISARY